MSRGTRIAGANSSPRVLRHFRETIDDHEDSARAQEVVEQRAVDLRAVTDQRLDLALNGVEERGAVWAVGQFVVDDSRNHHVRGQPLPAIVAHRPSRELTGHTRLTGTSLADDESAVAGGKREPYVIGAKLECDASLDRRGDRYEAGVGSADVFRFELLTRGVDLLAHPSVEHAAMVVKDAQEEKRTRCYGDSAERPRQRDVAVPARDVVQAEQPDRT